MHERIKEVRKKFHLTQEEFADRLGIKRTAISNYEIGRNEPIDAVISLICREFNVNEDWLRNGNKPMFAPKSREDEVAAAVQKLASGRSEDFKRRFILALAGLKEEHWELLEQKMREIVGDRPVPDLEELEETLFTVPWFFQSMSAGTGEEAGQEEPEPLEIKKEPPKGTSFVARVHGHSMEPTYQNGDLVFVKAQPEVEIGEIGAFYMDGQMWIKERGDGVLISHNQEYDPIPMTDDVRCQGFVLGVCDESYF